MTARKSKTQSGASPPGPPMRWSLLLALICVLGAGTVVLAQSGATYDLHWHVMSNGGGPISGATYQMNFTFGQPSTVFSSSGASLQVYQHGYWQPWPAPTAVELGWFEAEPFGAGILVSWETVAEWDNLGFNLYRQAGVDGPVVQLNEALIPSESPGAGEGASYAFYDPAVVGGVDYRYYLEDVDANGQRTMHGPVEATAPYAMFLPLVQR